MNRKQEVPEAPKRLLTWRRWESGRECWLDLDNDIPEAAAEVGLSSVLSCCHVFHSLNSSPLSPFPLYISFTEDWMTLNCFHAQKLWIAGFCLVAGIIGNNWIWIAIWFSHLLFINVLRDIESKRVKTVLHNIENVKNRKKNEDKGKNRNWIKTWV